MEEYLSQYSKTEKTNSKGNMRFVKINYPITTLLSITITILQLLNRHIIFKSIIIT